MTTVYNPALPLNLIIQGGVQPGKLIRIQGFVPHNANRFAVRLKCSSYDVALNLSPDFVQRCIVRSFIQNMVSGIEERSGFMPIQPGQNFDLLILCDNQNFKIAFNGQHFTEFNHRLPYSAITNLEIEGQVNIYSVNIDVNKNNPSQNIGLVIPPPSNHGPPPGHTIPPYPPGGPMGGRLYPDNPVGHTVYNPHPPQTGYNDPPYPQQPPSGHTGGYPNSQPPHGLYPQQPPSSHTGGYPQSHPSSQGGYPHSPKAHKSSGLLDKAGMAVAGVLGTSALLGGRKNTLGVLGEKLGAAMATATAITDRLNPGKAMKKQLKAQKKAHKKALKFGLPLAGAGIGAYALSKGIHGFRRSSSSSSSSSD